MDKNNFFIKSQIQSNIRSIAQLIDTGVFNADVLNIFREPVFVSIILKFNNLLQKFSQLENRIVFKDDISVGDIDITELIRRVRNAIGHLDSNENMLNDESQCKFVFNVVSGKMQNAFVINGKSYGSDYEDDIAVFYGEYRIYLKRHIVKAFQESVVIAKRLYPDSRI